MKKLILFLALAGWVYLCQAQDQVQTQTQGQEHVKLKRHIVIKYVPINKYLESNSFEVEAMVNPKNSITLGIGIPTNQSVNGKYGMQPSTEIIEDKFGTTHIRAAYRHYSSKKMLPRGFYIEPYLKYQKIDFTIKGQFTGNDNVNYNAQIASSIKTYNMGFQLGVQFLLFKRVAIDWYFLGIEGGMLSGDLNAKVNPTTYVPDMKNEVDKAIADFPAFLSNKLKTTQTSDAVNVNAKSVPYPWLRTGISIGIAF